MQAPRQNRPAGASIRNGWLAVALISICCFSPRPARSQPSRTIILQPGRSAPLRIDLHYNFQNPLPPFPKEPNLAGKQLARALLPTVPPTALLRNITDNELLLNTQHTRDFVDGLLARYRSTYNGHVFFQGIRVSTVRDGLEIPYTLDLFTYEIGFAGWVHVRSGWEGELEVAGQKWKMAVVDNLDGRIGTDDILCLQRRSPEGTGPMLEIKPVPGTLFLEGRALNLAFAFKPAGNDPVLEVTLTETNPPLGSLSIAAQHCTLLRLGNDHLTAVLDATAGTNSIPAGTYAIEGCLLDGISGSYQMPPTLIRSSRKVVIEPGRTTALEVGPPLRNTVQVTRDRNILRLTYQLLGQAGEQYEYYNWRDRPRFSVYKGPFKIGGGALPFG